MEFPMKNSDLQNIAIAFETDRKNKSIDNIVNSITDLITAIAYSQSSGRKHAMHITGTGNIYTNNVTNKKLNVPIPNLVSLAVPTLTHRNTFYEYYNIVNYKDHVPEIISRIQQLFPEMKIMVDPLETYILFDWS